MNLKEFVQHLDEEKVCSKHIPCDFLNLYYDTYAESNNFITIAIDERSNYKIIFDTFISWDINNNEIVDIEVDVDIINIEEDGTDDFIKLDNIECINHINKWLGNLIMN